MKPFLGQILIFAGANPPADWAICDGTIYPILGYEALYCVIGNTYGGDGTTTFALPDLRGRMPIQAGNAPSLSPRQLGETGGTETTTLTVNELPPHKHELEVLATVSPNAYNGGGDETNPGQGYPATADSDLYSEDSNTTMAPSPVNVDIVVKNTGGGDPVNIMNPFLSINFIISLKGEHPY